MTKIRTFKVPKRNRLLNANQRVFVIFRVSGAAYVLGKHRGKGRWIKTWVKYGDNCPEYREIDLEPGNPILKRCGIYENSGSM